MTSYEDLPADLFGEPDDPPAAPPSRGEAADPSPPSGDAAEAAATDAGGVDAEGADRRSPLAMVQSLFPGRIVAIEPLDGPDDASAEAEGAGAPSDPDEAGANDPDDGPPAASG